MDSIAVDVCLACREPERKKREGEEMTDQEKAIFGLARRILDCAGSVRDISREKLIKDTLYLLCYETQMRPTQTKESLEMSQERLERVNAEAAAKKACKAVMAEWDVGRLPVKSHWSRIVVLTRSVESKWVDKQGHECKRAWYDNDWCVEVRFYTSDKVHERVEDSLPEGSMKLWENKGKGKMWYSYWLFEDDLKSAVGFAEALSAKYGMPKGQFVPNSDEGFSE